MIDAIMNAPVLMKIAVSLAAIVVVNRITRRLLIAMVTGTLVLGFWCGHGPLSFLAVAGRCLVSTDTVMLMVVVFQVVWLSSQMRETSVMEGLVKAVLLRVPGRSAIAVLPAMIGLLPMPGGAWFSAPLVEQCDDRARLSPDVKTSVNYWFRHIWESWWPLYPGVLLAVEKTGLEIWKFALIQLPLTLVMIVAGYLIFLRRVPADMNGNHQPVDKTEHANIPALLSPIIATVGVYAAVEIGWFLLRSWQPDIPVLNRYIPMMCGLVTAQSLLQVQRPLGRAGWKTIILSKRTFMLAVLVIAVLVYGAFIECDLPDDGPLVQRIEHELDLLGLPTITMVVALPFIAGISTGLAVGMVGASFPIVMSLIGPDPGIQTLAATTILAYASGYAGMMLSPVHVCLLVTNEYFGTSLSTSLRKLLLPAAMLVAGAAGIHLLIRLL